MHTVSNARGITLGISQKFGFSNSSSSQEDVLKSTEINTVFIATPHNSHSTLTSAALKAGKNVFVKKPLAIDYQGLEEVIAAKKESTGVLMVGFNRRFLLLPVTLERRLLVWGSPW